VLKRCEFWVGVFIFRRSGYPRRADAASTSFKSEEWRDQKAPRSKAKKWWWFKMRSVIKQEHLVGTGELPSSKDERQFGLSLRVVQG
jgi:hypothetical protein